MAICNKQPKKDIPQYCYRKMSHSLLQKKIYYLFVNVYKT